MLDNVKREENTELVSIIMAAYNAEKTLEIAVNSVISQTYTNWELLIINDCSWDRTETIAAEYAEKDNRIRLLNNEKNCGVSISRKNGLMAASGQWIAILDSDDAWASEKLEKQFCLQKEKSADILFTGSAFMDENGNPIDWYLHAPSELTYRKLLKQNLLSNSSVLVRRELYEMHYAIGDYMHEDFALWLNILKTDVIAYGIDEPLLTYRISKSSKTGNKIKSAKMNWNTYRYVGLNFSAALYYMCWYLIRGMLKYGHLQWK